MQLLLVTGFHRIGHHQIRLAVYDLPENGDVVRMHGQRGRRQAGASELFIGAARVDDQFDLGLVDLGDGLEALRVFAAGDRRFAVVQIRQRVQRPLLPLQIDRHPAHRDIELAGSVVAHQRRPAGGHQFQLDAQRPRQALGHFDIQAAVVAAGIAFAERAVVAGGAHPHAAALQDVVQAVRQRRLARHQAAHQQAAQHLFLLHHGRFFL